MILSGEYDESDAHKLAVAGRKKLLKRGADDGLLLSTARSDFKYPYRYIMPLNLYTLIYNSGFLSFVSTLEGRYLLHKRHCAWRAKNIQELSVVWEKSPYPPGCISCILQNSLYVAFL